MFKIEAAVFQINLGITNKAVHAFWVLKNSNNLVVAALHGLATSRKTGDTVTVGYSADHTLRAYHTVYDDQFAKENGYEKKGPNLKIDRMKTLYEGDDALTRWKRAIEAIDFINALDLNYSPFGVNFFAINDTLNSNSIYRTFGECMSLDNFQFDDLIYVGTHKSLYKEVASKLTPASENVVLKS